MMTFYVFVIDMFQNDVVKITYYCKNVTNK